jgi:hypothetical protein
MLMFVGRRWAAASRTFSHVELLIDRRLFGKLRSTQNGVGLSAGLTALV